MSSVKLCSQRTQQHLNRPSLTPCSGSDLPGWSWSWGLIYIIIIFDTNQEICPWKKNFRKTNNWIRQVVDLPGWGWSLVLIYTSPTSSHLLHSQQKQKVNNFLVKTRSSWLPAGSSWGEGDYEIGWTWIICYFPFYCRYEIEWDLIWTESLWLKVGVYSIVWQTIYIILSECWSTLGFWNSCRASMQWCTRAPAFSTLARTMRWFHPQHSSTNVILKH